MGIILQSSIFRSSVYLQFIFLFIAGTCFITAQTDDRNTSTFGSTVFPISVTIAGSFLETGSFPAYLNERVDQYVTRIYTEMRGKMLNLIDDQQLLLQLQRKIYETVAFRDIVLKRVTGEVLHIDLLKYRITGDFKDNPYLKNDDVLIFPVLDLDKNYFSVEGAVNQSSKFQFVEGDRLSDALELALGINPAYPSVKQASILRMNLEGTKQEEIITAIDSNIPLQRGDRIRVLAEETMRRDYRVLVLGEVKQPGYIPITRNSTTLAEAVELAGGFLPTASRKNIRIVNSKFLPSSYFEKEFGFEYSRDLNKLDEMALPLLTSLENLRYYRLSNMNEQDTAYFFLENRLETILQGQTINLENADGTLAESSNIKVFNGEMIVVPRTPSTVRLIGQFRLPGEYNAVPGGSLEEYVALAGGASEYAKDLDEAILIKYGTLEWQELGNEDKPVTIEPGDCIYLPKRWLRSTGSYVGEYAGYLGIAGSIATIVLLITQLTK